MRSEGFSHKALGVIKEALELQARDLEDRLAREPDESDHFNDLHYVRILIEEVQTRIDKLVAQLGTS